MKGETLFLKAVVFLAGVPILALCIYGLPWIARDLADHFPARLLYPVLAGMYAAAIPFFLALYQTMKLLSYIDKNIAFSEISVTALKNIKYCAVAISVSYAASMPFWYFMADIDDAPGILVIGLVLMFAPLVIAVFAAVLEKLLKNAIDIKSENDLTV